MKPAPHPAPAEARAPLDGAVLAARLECILGGLWALVARRIHLFGDLANPLRCRLARAQERLVTLLLAFAAGRTPRHRARPPGQPARSGGKPAIHLPRTRAWLVASLGYQAAGYGSQLEALLRDPETQATLAAAITRSPGIARTLRPLCRMLGVSMPPPLQLPPRPPRLRPQPAPKPQRPALPPLLPIYPQRHPRPMPFLRPPQKFRPA
jgi:hypothetical protein